MAGEHKLTMRYCSARRGLRRLAATLVVTGGVLWLAPPVTAQDGGAAAATYEVTFQGNWITASTPDGVVSGAHFTTLVGAVHNDGVTFWRSGGRASRGVEIVAERGVTPPFESEIDASPHAAVVIKQSIGGGGTASATFLIDVTRDHPLVTLLSMIGPSPDWFVGISGLSLLDGSDQWVPRLEVDLFPYDAGTEEGTEFSLDNLATDPQGTITSIRGAGKFSNERMARLTFVRQAPERPGPPGVTPGDGTLDVSWTAVPGAESYTVQWRSGLEEYSDARQQTVQAPSATLLALTNGSSYTVRVRASNAGGDSDWSQEATGTPLQPVPALPAAGAGLLGLLLALLGGRRRARGG